MNFELKHDQRAMVNTVRELAQDKFRPNTLKYMDGTFPWDNMRDLAKIGVLGMAVPEEYGGLGLPVLDTALVIEEISKACYVTAMAVMGEVGVQYKIIDNFAPESIKRRLLPGVCTYARDRSAFGRPIGEFQAIRHKLAEMYRDIEASRSLLYRACATANPFPDPYLAAIAKITVNEMSLRVTSDAIQIHGGYGFTDEFPVSRFYRGARYGTLGGGTTETLKELVGKKIMTDFPIDGFLGMGTF
jgi:alkylation response protein AidB-like acyl-CoA dehydrogenase